MKSSTLKRALALTLAFLMAIVVIPASSKEVSAAYAMMRQTDTQWHSVYVNGGSLAGTGCGIFSLVNAVGYLTGNQMDVVEVANWGHSIGSFNVTGADGTYRTSFYHRASDKYGATYGFVLDCDTSKEGYWDGAYSTLLKNHLANGGAAIAHVYNHFIALVGYNASNNTFHVWDSAPRDTRGTLASGGDLWVTENYLRTQDYMTVDWFCLVSTTKSWVEKAAFDPMVYRDSNPDIAGVADMTNEQLENHWLTVGIKEGRNSSPVLNLKYYLEQNADLQAAFGTDYTKVYNHFVNNGYKEKRKTSTLFDGTYYCENNPSIASSYGDNYMKHYVETGIKEGRRGALTFDPDYYWFLKPEVNEAWPGHYELCAKHYAGYGVREGVKAYDDQNPVISNVKVTNISSAGYTVTCTVTDNWGIDKVSFPTWTLANNQDDLAADFLNTQLGTKNGDTYTFQVKASDHNNETGQYATHIYATDLGGNRVSLSSIPVVNVEGSSSGDIVVGGTTGGNTTVQGGTTSTSGQIKLISTSWYSVVDNTVFNVKSLTTVNSYAKHFSNTGLRMFKADGTEIGGETLVGTGAVLKLYSGSSVVDSVTVVVQGDTDGNGKVDTTDVIRVKAAFVGSLNLDKYQTSAADMSANGSMDISDYMKIKALVSEGVTADPDPDPETTTDPEPTPEPEPEPEPEPTPTYTTPVLSSDLKPSYTFSQTLTVTQSGSTASVVTGSGVPYTATGYSSYSSNSFYVGGTMTMTFDGRFNSSFNRLTLCYTSTQPMKCTVTYKVGSTTVNDLFYLEAGTQTFCGLIQGYLAGNKATNLTSIKVTSCKGGSANFALHHIATENYTVYNGDVHYIDSTIYKLGIRISWGGGICYLNDKSYASEGITNLINQADTGRLVQQSYYGTYSNGEYTSLTYNNATWPYNPVQGGDRFNNPSRIIDVVVNGAAIYIKAQPQDWAHNGEITPSYMENVYKLVDNFIRVDNRFVDFSGWEHRYANQELPAFYTVSYLNNFTYYGGTASWTDGALTSRSDLPFWGDAATHDSCIFRMKGNNTETWCAWTNSTSGYGIGLFVPNVDMFLAGKHAYNGSKDAKNGATNYVAPINTLKIVSYQPIEYSYMMTTGTLASIRNTFKVHRNFATNASLHTNYRSERA